MLLTAEQEEIVNSSLDSFKINAVAGSGKTTTLLEYAKKNSHLKILYLAYNKSLQIELQEKLKGEDPGAVWPGRCEGEEKARSSRLFLLCGALASRAERWRASVCMLARHGLSVYLSSG